MMLGMSLEEVAVDWGRRTIRINDLTRVNNVFWMEPLKAECVVLNKLQNQKFLARHMFLNKVINKCNAENMQEWWKRGGLIISEVEELRASYLALRHMTSCCDFPSAVDLYGQGMSIDRAAADLAFGQQLMTTNEH